VVETFATKDLSEEVALQNARLAKILTAEDYDKGPILWTPSADYKIDDGAGSEDASN
jgi:DNA polymerase-1